MQGLQGGRKTSRSARGTTGHDAARRLWDEAPSAAHTPRALAHILTPPSPPLLKVTTISALRGRLQGHRKVTCAWHQTLPLAQSRRSVRGTRFDVDAKDRFNIKNVLL